MFNLNQINVLLLDAEQLKQVTKTDSVFMKVLQYTQNAWPTEMGTELRPYYCRREELTGGWMPTVWSESSSPTS